VRVVLVDRSHQGVEGFPRELAAIARLEGFGETPRKPPSSRLHVVPAFERCN
jgi:hypothetical protein